MPQVAHPVVFDTLSDWEPGYAIACITTRSTSASPDGTSFGRLARWAADHDCRGLRIHPDSPLRR